MSIQISSVRKNDKDQTVFFILIDDEGIARKMGADTPILSGAELQEYLDARGEEYLALALAKEAGGKVLQITREEQLAAINQAVCTYIYSRYDAGTQASFLALSILSEAAKAATTPVWAWIQAVMSYYYGLKTQIADPENPAWASVTWDFTSFDATDPGVNLSDLIGA